MGYIEGNCPNCGAKTGENCNAWVYGSPIRTCPKCKSEYLDNRWREVAIDGFDPRSNSPSFYIKGFFGFLIFTIACIAVLIWMIRTQGHYPVKLLGCALLGIVGTLGCGVVFLRIKLGYEEKKNAVFLEESKRRLQDKEYVEKLVSYGYNIPAEYRINAEENGFLS